MPLEPQTAAALAMLNQIPSFMNIPLAIVRRMPVPGVPNPTPLAEIREIAIPAPHGTIGARLYRPRPVPELPLLVFFHGGGFVLGTLDSHDEICRQLARAADCAVLSVDYRLAPEHPFPAAPDDALTATCWAAEHALELGADPSRIAVGGDSAGGNLAAVTALRARDEGGPVLVAQMLVYPITSAHTPPTRSMIENAEGYFLTQEMVEWFGDRYMPDPSARSHPHFAVLAAPDLAGLPPAYVVTAQYDPLRDEAEAYAARLKAAGVPVEAIRYDGTIHGFFGMPGIDLGTQALNRAAAWLNDIFTAQTASQKSA